MTIHLPPVTIDHSNPLGTVHCLTMRMNELASLVMRLHPDSPSRSAKLAEYIQVKAKAKKIRSTITQIDERKTATWLIRTASKPVDNCGNPLA